MIFEKKINDSGWKTDGSITVEWFEKNMGHFKFFGRDMETLFSKVKFKSIIETTLTGTLTEVPTILFSKDGITLETHLEAPVV